MWEAASIPSREKKPSIPWGVEKFMCSLILEQEEALHDLSWLTGGIMRQCPGPLLGTRAQCTVSEALCTLWETSASIKLSKFLCGAMLTLLGSPRWFSKLFCIFVPQLLPGFHCLSHGTEEEVLWAPSQYLEPQHFRTGRELRNYLIQPFISRWEDWGTERLNDLLKFTHLVVDGANIHISILSMALFYFKP